MGYQLLTSCGALYDIIYDSYDVIYSIINLVFDDLYGIIKI